MIKVFAIDSRDKYIAELKRALFYYLGLHCVTRSTVKEMAPILELFPYAELIVVADHYDHPNDLRKIIATRNNYLPMISYETTEDVVVLIKKIALELEKSLDLEALKHKLHLSQPYLPISLSLVSGMTMTPSDLFIKIGKGVQANYVKRVQKLDEIDPTVLTKLEQGSVEYLYVPDNEFDLFSTALTNQIIDGMSQRQIETSHKIGKQAQGFTYIRKVTEVLDFDEQFIEVLNQSIDSVNESLRNDRPLSHLIKELMNRKDSLSFQCYYLTNLICFHLLQKLKLDINNNLKTLISASLFCDLGQDQSELLLVNSMEEFHQMNSKLTKEKQEHILNHARMNSSWASQIPNIQPIVSTIIKEHHGSPNGIGFEDTMAKQINNLSQVFVIANSFIKYFLNPKYQFNKKKIIEIMQNRYTDAQYQKIITELTSKIE